MEFKSILNKTISYKAMLDNTKTDFKDNELKITQHQKELHILDELHKNTSLAHEYLESIIKEESTKFVKMVQDIIDHGVKTIFFDEEYSIDIRVEDDTTTIHLITKDVDGNVISPDIKNCGGGVRTVCGIMLQLFFIFHYKAEPILFIDEGFSQVSSIYIPYLMGLLHELALKKKLKILLVSHDPRIMSYADKTYEILNGKAILKSNKKSNVEVIEGGQADEN